MNELQVFKNEQFGEIRTIEENGKPWFCGADVARALGYSNPYDAMARHCKQEGIAKREGVTKTTNQHGATSEQVNEIKYIDEGNLYRLITHSKLPEAQKFADWFFDEVLPTIRKTGGYVNNDEMFINTYLPHADEGAKAAFRHTLQTLRAANEKIERDAPKVLFAEAVTTARNSILIGELAKLLRQNGVEIGQNRLFEWLRNNGYLVKRKGTDYNAPTQRSMEAGLFEVKENTITHNDGSTTVTRTTKVTGKGQVYFINRFLREWDGRTGK